MLRRAAVFSVVGFGVSFICLSVLHVGHGSVSDVIDRVREWRNPSGLDLLTGVHINKPQNYMNAPELNARMIKVTEGLHVGVDYGMGNSIFIDAPEGIIVVDTTESNSVTERMLKDYRKISDKRIAAIVYTHHHADHTFGTQSYIEDPSNPPDIWAHKTQKEQLNQILLTFPRYLKGGIHQYGASLYKLGGKESYVNPRFLDIDFHRSTPPVEANRYLEQDVETVEIAGLNVTFIYQPGESEDQLAVWLPDRQAILSGDNVYPQFPNLYSIRGVPPRNPRHWYESVMKLRDLNAKYLVESHANPVIGEDKIHAMLTAYISAIKFLHDQTIRMINQGIHPDEIAASIKLPRSLQDNPYLTQEYGLVAWSSKGVYEQQVGWFSGDPVELMPHTPRDRSRKMVAMMGEEALLKHGEEALGQDDPQWALELASYVLNTSPMNAHAMDIRTEALRSLAGKQTNPVARNYYLTATFDDHNLIDWNQLIDEYLINIDLLGLFSIMSVRLNADAVEDLNITVILRATDTKQTYKIQIFYSVLYVDLIPEETTTSKWTSTKCSAGHYDVKLSGTEETLKKILIRKCSAFSTCGSEKVEIDGSGEVFRRFVGYFDQ